MERSIFCLLTCLVGVTACGGSPQPSCDKSDASCALSCGPGVDSPPYEGATHVAVGTTVTYSNNPPASGNHWPAPKEPWDFYPAGIAREQWVHNLEHGGIVLLWNCPAACDDVVSALKAIRDQQPQDQYGEVRILGTPDSLMPHRVAALAWNWRWQGDVVDAAAINCFIAARYDRAPESIP